MGFEADADEVSAVVVVAVAAAVVVKVVRAKTKAVVPNIRVPNIQTCLRETGWGAPCTSGGGSQLSSVRSRPHALGRIFILKSQRTISETGTSPV